MPPSVKENFERESNCNRSHYICIYLDQHSWLALQIQISNYLL